jgi:hypothetical protein
VPVVWILLDVSGVVVTAGTKGVMGSLFFLWNGSDRRRRQLTKKSIRKMSNGMPSPTMGPMIFAMGTLYLAVDEMVGGGVVAPLNGVPPVMLITLT